MICICGSYMKRLYKLSFVYLPTGEYVQELRHYHQSPENLSIKYSKHNNIKTCEMETSEATNLCVMMGTLLKIQEHMENIDSDTVAPRQNQRKTNYG